jgi:hypothetical protein
VVAVEGIPQAVADHGVDQLGVAHLGAVAQMHAVGRLAHAFLTAGDNDFGVARPDRLEAERHGAQAGAAQLIDAIGGLLDRDAGVDRRLAGGVLPGSRRQHLPQHHFGHLARLDARALQRFANGHLAQVVGRHRAQRAIERTGRGTGGSGYDNFRHVFPPFRN